MLNANAIVGVPRKRKTLSSVWLRAICCVSPDCRRLTPALRSLGAIAGIAAAASITYRIAGSAAWMPSAALIGVAVIVIATGAEARGGAGAEAWLDVLGRAFDDAPAAQLIAAADGRVVQSNIAFARLFACEAEASLDMVERAATSPEAATMFRSLRERAEAGVTASGSVALQLTNGERLRHFEMSVEPGIGHARYQLWTVREVGAPSPFSGALPAEPNAAVGDPGVEDGRGAVSRPTPALPAPAATDIRMRTCSQHFFADAPIGIAVVDCSGRVIGANRAVGELLDVPEGALVGRRLIDLLSPEDALGLAAALAAAANESENRARAEVRVGARSMLLLLNPLGGPEVREQVLVSVSAPSPAVAPGAEPTKTAVEAFTVYFTDVTDQKHLETQIAQSLRMQALGQLSGGIAHDFNNLLTAMIGFCDLLLLRSRPGDPAFPDIMQIKQNANRAANLVRQLLAFSRQQSLQPRVLEITDMLIELSDLLRRLIGEDIELEFDHGSDLGLVRADQSQFEQVIINLAVNARDAMPAGGRLTIRTRNSLQEHAVCRGTEIVPPGEYVLIEVADTGIGMLADQLPRIFEPFFSTKEIGRGTGLGLSTVYGIVKQTGGYVFVDSIQGRGTRFLIYLPRCAAVHEPRLGAADPTVPRDLTGNCTIMLVEDDDAVRMFSARALRNKGYRVLEARSGEAALGIVRNSTERVDLVVTDVVMPQMDGPAVVRELRAIAPAIKVIFISGYAEDAFRQRLDSERDIHFLPKPFNLKQLALKVKEVIPAHIVRSEISDCLSEQKEYIIPPASRCTAALAVK